VRISIALKINGEVTSKANITYEFYSHSIEIIIQIGQFVLTSSI